MKSLNHNRPPGYIQIQTYKHQDATWKWLSHNCTSVLVRSKLQQDTSNEICAPQRSLVIWLRWELSHYYSIDRITNMALIQFWTKSADRFTLNRKRNNLISTLFACNIMPVRCKHRTEFSKFQVGFIVCLLIYFLLLYVFSVLDRCSILIWLRWEFALLFDQADYKYSADSILNQVWTLMWLFVNKIGRFCHCNCTTNLE